MFANRDIGIDLGTANVLVFQKGKGIVLREPSVVAIDNDKHELKAVGMEAKEMIGRTPGSIVAIRPIRDGVIANFEITKRMLNAFINKANKDSYFSKPHRIVICLPCGVSEVEKRAIEEAARQCGYKNVYLIEEPMAAAIGAGLPVNEPQGNMIVDIGGGTTEVAVISFGGIVSSRSIRLAGDKLDNAIVSYLKKEHCMIIGDRTAEDIKISIGTATPRPKEIYMNVRGRNLETGLPKAVRISSTQVMEALGESIQEMIDAIRFTLEKTPPELASDIIERGIVLSGGGALLYGLDIAIRDVLKVPVYIAENPLDCVAIGTGKIIENFNLYHKVLKK